MKRYLCTAATGLVASLYGHAAAADISPDDLLAAYQEQGFDFIEITVGLDQIKVEAIEGTQQLEVIYDRETGVIIETEQEAADAEDVGRTGSEIRSRPRNFTDDDDDDEDDDEDDDDDDDDDDDHRGDDSGSGSGSDDDDEDDDEDDDDDDDGDDDDDD